MKYGLIFFVTLLFYVFAKADMSVMSFQTPWEKSNSKKYVTMDIPQSDDFDIQVYKMPVNLYERVKTQDDNSIVRKNVQKVCDITDGVGDNLTQTWALCAMPSDSAPIPRDEVGNAYVFFDYTALTLSKKEGQQLKNYFQEHPFNLYGTDYRPEEVWIISELVMVYVYNFNSEGAAIGHYASFDNTQLKSVFAKWKNLFSKPLSKTNMIQALQELSFSQEEIDKLLAGVRQDSYFIKFQMNPILYTSVGSHDSNIILGHEYNCQGNCFSGGK